MPRNKISSEKNISLLRQIEFSDLARCSYKLIVNAVLGTAKRWRGPKRNWEGGYGEDPKCRNRKAPGEGKR